MTVDLVTAVLVIGVTAYAVLGGADFGAGFWDLTAGGARRGARVRGLVKRSMGPVWEANHVWLIFVLVIFWTGFPEAFGAVMSTLYVPLFAAAVGIILRGVAFAVRGEAATIREARGFGATFALSSVLVPFFLGATIGAVATGAYLAAVFMAADAVRAGLPDLIRAFRARALGAAAVTGALAVGGILVVREDAPDLYDGLTSGAGLVAVIGSVIAGSVTAALLWRGRFGPARFTSAVAVGAVIVGLALALAPDLLPGVLSLDQAAAGDDTLIPLLACVVLAVVILVPSLTLLYRLTLRGTLDTEFRPIVAADREERP